MNLTMKITSTLALIVGIVTVSSGAFATNTREAIKMCDKNPKCTMRDIGSGQITVTVPGAGGVVTCPIINGPCQVRTVGNHHFDHIGEGGNAQAQENNSTGGGTDGGGTIY